LADYGAGGDGIGQAQLTAFNYGSSGPLAAAGLSQVWAVADAKPTLRRLLEAGCQVDGQAQLARPALSRLTRRVQPVG
jgi:hypothetical protein